MMLFKFFTLLSIFSTIALFSSCSSAKFEYKYDENFKQDDYPKNVFIDDQIYELNTNGNLMGNMQNYTEIITITGERYLGKLFNISQKQITLIVESKVDFKLREPIDKDKIKIMIPKDEIIIVKYW